MFFRETVIVGLAGGGVESAMRIMKFFDSVDDIEQQVEDPWKRKGAFLSSRADSAMLYGCRKGNMLNTRRNPSLDGRYEAPSFLLYKDSGLEVLTPDEGLAAAQAFDSRYFPGFDVHPLNNKIVLGLEHIEKVINKTRDFSLGFINSAILLD